MVSQNLTGLTDFWGETWLQEGNFPGVIPDLFKRIGMLRHLAGVTSKVDMASLLPGMFSSKLYYDLHLTEHL